MEREPIPVEVKFDSAFSAARIPDFEPPSGSDFAAGKAADHGREWQNHG